MKTIAIAAVTAGGKTTIVNELKKQIANTKVLHFDDYSFEGKVDNFQFEMKKLRKCRLVRQYENNYI